jgi:hypothetical protein
VRFSVQTGIESDVLGIVAEQSGPDAVEGAGPAQRVVHDAGFIAEDLARDPLDSLRMPRGARMSSTGSGEDPRRLQSDAQRGEQAFPSAGPGAGDDQQGSSDMTIGSHAVLDGSTLLRIERFEIGCSRRREHELSP